MKPHASAPGYDQAAAAYRRGDLPQAEAICEAILAKRPREFSALHMLGVLHLKSGRAERGLALVDRALRERPNDAGALGSRGNGLLELGRKTEALAAHERAAYLQPHSAVHHDNVGNVLLALGRTAEARDALRQSIALDARRPSAHTNLGIALLRLGRSDEALACHDHALLLDARFADAWANRAATLLIMRRPAEALESYRTALDIHPGLIRARHGACRALLDHHQPQDALALADEVLARLPGERAAVVNRAAALEALGRTTEAKEALESVAADLGSESDLDVLNSLGVLQRRCGQLQNAERTMLRLWQLAPDYPCALGNLVDVQLQACSWNDLVPRIDALMPAVRAGRFVTTPFCLAALPSSPAEQRQCAETLVRQDALVDRATRPVKARAVQDRIRLAYVSPDFREHPVANQIGALLATHDRTKFEVIGVALQPDDGSVPAARARGACERVVDAHAMTDDEVLVTLDELQADIAIDLAGYTQGARPSLFARRMAPVQVNYLGYPGTLASTGHDYIIADPWVIPAGHEHWYSERVVRLPGSYQPYDPDPRAHELQETRSDAALPECGFVFCCFNNQFKLNPPMFDVWMRILARVPGSVLWLAPATDYVRENLRREAAARGIEGARLVFAQRKASRLHHIARYALADLFLDTLPFNAHATASDALWAGLPVLTCLGDSFAGRVAAGMVAACDMPELVVDTMDAYVEAAVGLAHNPAQLQALRNRLVGKRSTLPMFDLPAYCRNLEAAFLEMHRAAVERAPGADPYVASALPAPSLA